MPTRRNATRAATSTNAGILRPDEFARYAQLERLPCSPALTPYVENHWWLEWHLPEGSRYLSSTLPHPSCTLSVELGHPRAGVGDDRVILTGVITERFDVELAASGRVLGTKFRPGGLAALTGLKASSLTGRSLPAAGLLPTSVIVALRHLTDAMDSLSAREAADRAEHAIAALLPERADPVYEQLLTVVTDMLGDRTLVRVAQIAARHHLSPRHLQRLFARYVGVSPKWLLARYRMHDVVAAIDAGYDGSLADLAATHGWYDQGHFARDFTALVGTPPSRYRRD